MENLGFTLTCNRCGCDDVVMEVDLDTGVMTLTCPFCQQSVDVDREQEEEEVDELFK